MVHKQDKTPEGNNSRLLLGPESGARKSITFGECTTSHGTQGVNQRNVEDVTYWPPITMKDPLYKQFDVKIEK